MATKQLGTGTVNEFDGNFTKVVPDALLTGNFKIKIIESGPGKSNPKSVVTRLSVGTKETYKPFWWIEACGLPVPVIKQNGNIVEVDFDDQTEATVTLEKGVPKKKGEVLHLQKHRTKAEIALEMQKPGADMAALALEMSQATA